MKIRNALSAVLACAVATLVAAWLVGSFVTYAYHSLAPAGRDAIALAGSAWAASSPVQIVRRLEPVTVVGHRHDGRAVAPSFADAP